MRRGGGDDARLSAAGAAGAVARAADEAAVGLDLDLQERGVVAAGEGGEGLAAADAVALVGGQVENLLGGGQVIVVAAAVALVSGLLTAAAFGLGGGGVGRVYARCGLGGVGVGLGLVAEEAVLEVTDLGLKSCALALEGGLALAGALVLGLVVAGLLSGVAEGSE